MRSVIAFTSQPNNPYTPVSSLQFGAPPVMPGNYQVPTYPIRFPNPSVNKALANPLMSVMTIYNFERMGKMQI